MSTAARAQPSELHHLQLIDVSVCKIIAEKRQERDPDQSPSEAPNNWILNSTLSYRQTAPSRLDIKLEATLEYPPDTPMPFSLSVEIVGRYQSADPIPDREIPVLLQTHSYPLLWPYLRELVSHLTLRMGGPIVTIPTLRIALPSSERPRRGRRQKQAKQNPQSVTPVDDRIEE